MDGNQKRIYLLEKEDVRKSLLKLGMPTMIGMIVSALYNIVDAFFVGRLGTMQTAAVSLVYPLTMVGTGIGLLFGSGAGSYISRLLGKKEYDEVKICSSIAFFSGIFLITVLVTIMLLFFNPLMNTLGATDGTLYYVREYGLIYILGLILNVFNIMMNNMIVAEGSSSFSMTGMLFGCLTNFILDPVLIFGCHMGVSGAAIATLISQLISTSFYGFYILKGDTFLKISFSYFKIKRTIYTEIFKIGLPVCFFQILTGGAVSLTNIVAKPFGEAAMGIVNRLMSLESNALYGFLKGYSPLVGYNYGAGKIDRVETATKTAICWSTVINVLFGILCILFSKQLIYLFNQESIKVLEIGRAVLIVDSISFMTLGVQIVIGNYFLAIGKAKQGGMLSICRQGLLFIPCMLILTNFWGMTGLIATQLVADVCATIITAVMWFKEKSLQLV